MCSSVSTTSFAILFSFLQISHATDLITCIPIYLVANEVKSLRWATSSGHLSELVISENDVDFDKLNKICDIKHVRFFNFSGSRILVLRKNTISRFKMLKSGKNQALQPTLDLSYTGLQYIELGALEPVRESVKTIYLQGNYLRSFPEELCYLKKLESLILDSNAIASKQLTIPYYCRIDSLTTLSLTNNAIESLGPLFCSHFPNLKQLNLRENFLTKTNLKDINSCSNLMWYTGPKIRFRVRVIACETRNLRSLDLRTKKAAGAQFRAFTHQSEWYSWPLTNQQVRCDSSSSSKEFQEPIIIHRTDEAYQLHCSMVLQFNPNFKILILSVIIIIKYYM